MRDWILMVLTNNGSLRLGLYRNVFLMVRYPMKTVFFSDTETISIITSQIFEVMRPYFTSNFVEVSIMIKYIICNVFESKNMFSNHM